MKLMTKPAVRSKSVQETYDLLIQKLDAGNKVYFVRFGDGEFMAMQEMDHRNYKPSPDFAREVRESFLIKDENYLIANIINPPREKKTSKGVCDLVDDKYDAFNYLFENGLLVEDTEFECQQLFNYLALFKPKQLNFFLEKYVWTKRKMFVGGSPREVAEKLYGKLDYYVQTPFKNAYDTIDEWWPKVIGNIDKVDVIIPSAGATTNIIAKRLWELDKHVHLIDVGSIIDAVEGKVTRTWIRLLGHRLQRLIYKRDHGTVPLKLWFSYVLKDIRYFFRRQFVHQK